MRKALAVLGFLTALPAIGFSQAATIFQAGPSDKIQYTINGTDIIPFPTGNPASLDGYGPLTIAFMVAPDGTPLTLQNGLPDFTSAWTQAATVDTHIKPIPGVTSGGLITLPASAGAPGDNVELSIVAWTGSATTWQDAINGDATMLGWTGSSLSGGALEWSQPTGGTSFDEPLPTSVVTGNSGFNGLVLEAVPEASCTFLLCGLAMGGLVFFHRKIGAKNAD